MVDQNPGRSQHESAPCDGRDGRPPLSSFISTLFRFRKNRDGRRNACGLTFLVSRGLGRMRWEINKTVTYLPFPEAGLHNLSSLPSLFSLYSF